MMLFNICLISLFPFHSNFIVKRNLLVTESPVNLKVNFYFFFVFKMDVIGLTSVLGV